jgi:hypothetical protein
MKVLHTLQFGIPNVRELKKNFVTSIPQQIYSWKISPFVGAKSTGTNRTTPKYLGLFQNRFLISLG